MTKNEFVENVQPANSALFIYVSEIVDTFEYLRIFFPRIESQMPLNKLIKQFLVDMLK